MNKRLLYILGIAAAVLTSCSDEVADAPSPFLNGTEKTPLVATALLGVESAPQTRAADKTFDNGDQLVAYIRQVKWNGNTGARTLVNAQKSPSLITFTKGSTAMTAYSGSDITPIGTGVGLGLKSGPDCNTNVASDLTVSGGLYWDDFSINSANDGGVNSTYLRDPDHYLQSFYGYCYNGGTPSTALTEATGALGWTVESDQTATGAFQHSDLLWSAEQTPIAYSHATFNGGIAHGQLVLPYTHAMSKVTINLTARNGFADDFKFTATEVSLNNKNTVCTTTAPNLTLVASTEASTVKDIKMLGGSDETAKKRSYSAIIVPSILTQDALFATITGVDGNKYEIKVTSAMLQKGSEHEGKGWGDKLTSNTTQSGVHYVLDVTIDKQVITVSAALKDWDEVTAAGDGEIKFDNDITATGNIDIAFLKTNAFDVYKDASNASTSFATKRTTLTWNSGTAEWGYDPTIYWAGQSDASYFRALSPKSTTTDMSQGTDILWGYACDNDADKTKVGTSDEVKITPRTGDVPLHFEHPMSKISVILKNDKDASGNDIPTDARVTLTGAKISIINLYDKGTLNMADGSIGTLIVSDAEDPFTIKDRAVDASFKWLDNIVIPQSLVKDNADADREAAPTYYQTGELTLIYDDGTSLSTGGGSVTYYLTSSLETVTYEQGELTPIYADGTSIAPTGETDPSSETYVTSSLDLVAAQAEVKYTAEEVEEINAPHRVLGVDNGGKNPGDDGYVSTWKLVTDKNSIEPGADGYITTYEYPSDYTPITTDDVKVPAVPEHYKVNANSKKATISTFKCYKTKDGSEQHNPGDLKSAGSKIMMYITLADNTRYSIDLVTCKAYTEESEGNKTYGSEITEWKRGEHYTYTISLAKEAVTFRAMIKDWDERKGGGNANLDWD